MAVNPGQWHVGLVGYGEVGRILAEDLRARQVAVSAYDIKLEDDRAAPLRAHAAAHGVALAASHHDLAGGADLIVSAVTASQTVRVAQACAGAVRPGPGFSISIPPRPAPSSAPANSSTSAAGAMWKAR